MTTINIFRPTSLIGRILATTVALAMVNLSYPTGLANVFHLPKLQEGLHGSSGTKKAPLPPTRSLNDLDLKNLKGSAGQNPYYAGQDKFDVMFHGIDLMSGNFSTSATDLTFQGGYGIPVNVSRSYSANNMDEGAMGVGWTPSVDLRSTEGGLLKSESSPVASVPATIKERPSAQLSDPNAATWNGALTQPPVAVIATDAGGEEETIQKDVDGVLTTPPWDKNTIDSQYEYVSFNGSTYQVLKSNTVKTPEGTVYTYSKHGNYPQGSLPWNASELQTTPTPEPSNVLKVDSVTDRHGNITNYQYGGTQVQFSKNNGIVSEDPLISIQMPNQHIISFTWSGNRIVQASDGQGRQVTYGYTNGNLTSVTSPALLVTHYGYGGPDVIGGTVTWTGKPVLTSFTDARGLTTTIHYAISGNYVRPGENVWVQARISAYQIDNPNGTFASVETDPIFFTTLGTNYGGYPTYGSGEVYAVERHGSQSGPTSDTFSHLMWGRDGSGPWVYQDSEDDYDMPFKNTLVTARSYDPQENLIFESTSGDRYGSGNPITARRGFGSGASTNVYSVTSYNFLGNPLEKSLYEGNGTNYGLQDPYVRSSTSSFNYWGADKYYQQKAARTKGTDGAYRYSFTDYYSSTDANLGRRGQMKRIYDPKQGGVALDSSATIPNYATNSATWWRYQVGIAPGMENSFSAEFDYDSFGRVISATKLRSALTSPWTRVATQSIYGNDGPGFWGAATSVVEDAGDSSHLNRTSLTLRCTSDGKADIVKDAAGHVFRTDFDADGRVIDVVETDVVPSKPIVTYTYGNSGVSNGEVTRAVDNLSGVVQDFVYVPTGSGVGQIQSVTETSGGSSYVVSYTYNGAGDRLTSTYSTPNGTSTWRYSDYEQVGIPTDGLREYQTVTLMNGNNPTAEELQYAYDPHGRVRMAAFALTQTPDATVTNGITEYPSYYSNGPLSRALAYYTYDPSGRMLSLDHTWQWKDGDNQAHEEYVLGNACYYEQYEGLKTTSEYRVKHANDSTAFDVSRTEHFSYDPKLDYLTSASYGDGLPNANVSWTYDSLGNRVSDSSQSGGFAYDNLNRMTNSPGYPTYTSDILGNRLSRQGASISSGGTSFSPFPSAYTWDPLNRLTSYSANGTGHVDYSYRADGLRVGKTYHSNVITIGPLPEDTGVTTSHGNSTVGQVTQTADSSDPVASTDVADVASAYRYDGQMMMESAHLHSDNSVTVVKHALGARGVDRTETSKGSNVSVTYPIYDSHGNEVASIMRGSTATSYSVPTVSLRSYDAWGGVRGGNPTGGSRERYCANLGHVQDDESGLTYMRARYYESSSGRFLNEDPSMQGTNWFQYCSSDPINKVDVTGRVEWPLITSFLEMLGRQWHFTLSPGTRRITMAMDGIIEHVTMAMAAIEIGLMAFELAATCCLVVAAPVACLAASILACMAVVLVMAMILIAILKDGVEQSAQDGKEIGDGLRNGNLGSSGGGE